MICVRNPHMQLGLTAAVVDMLGIKPARVPRETMHTDAYNKYSLREYGVMSTVCMYVSCLSLSLCLSLFLSLALASLSFSISPPSQRSDGKLQLSWSGIRDIPFGQPLFLEILTRIVLPHWGPLNPLALPHHCLANASP